MQSKLISMKYSIILIMVLFFFSLFGVASYKGSDFYYFVFDVMWLTVLISSLSLSQSYIFFYLKIMLFLGVWLKLMFYLVLRVEFVEPTGFWNDVHNLGLYWDNALMVASYAALGILAADFVFYLYRRFYSNHGIQSLKNQVEVPGWYLKSPKKIWILLLSISLGISFINFKTHFYMIGLSPAVIFPCHINFLLSWALIFFLPLLLAYLMGLDALAQNYRNWHYAIIIACLISITTLSRSILIMWIIPCFYILFKENFSSLFTQYKKLVITYFVLAIISLGAVSMLRSYYFYSPSSHKTTSTVKKANKSERNGKASKNENRKRASKPKKRSDQLTLKKLMVHNKSNLKFQLQQLKSLPISRWVGIEGILATTAYPHTGWDLFKKAIVQKPTQKVSLYSKVSQSYLNLKTGTKFSSLPGLIGLLNYSDSYLIVCLGTFIICLLTCFIQFFYYRLGLNIYFLSQQGFLLAFFLTELNIPYLGVINFSEFILASLLLLLIHKYHVLFPIATVMRRGELKIEAQNSC
ncbi:MULTISPECIES: hypothetical protein [Legionella]|uniref:Uncharacterized protein n=1 Tax=Legionella resiliens TaxID=2905958 RepID=A0ABS8WY72_9GAMM|nr:MULTISPECIES: hypothetical protein [unclassified Legionella]MCE0722239.1 hypothetical protein [Legionella sp. 9fVS26]MCE3531393.1 hypothetical protein [Legionella sp. 8cVS16]QLZ67409.1 hypothetical protein FOLKNPGA_00174 [Legionella sp. PC1000]